MVRIAAVHHRQAELELIAARCPQPIPVPRRGPVPGGLVRVLPNEQVALVGDNAISVMQG